MRTLAVAVGMFASVAWSVPILPPPPDVIPATGATVGRNAKIWAFGSGGGVQLYDSQGMVVESTLTRITIPPFQALEKLTPVTPLQPGQYEVRGYEAVASSFTVADELDTTPPPKPIIEVSAFGKVGNMESAVRVTGPSGNDSFLVILGEPQVWEPTSIHAAGPKGTAIVYDLHAGPHRLKAVRVDAAGNASEPVEIETTVPEDRVCSVSPALPLSLLMLALLRRFNRAAA
jgi:hypothetical protein